MLGITHIRSEFDTAAETNNSGISNAYFRDNPGDTCKDSRC